MDIEQARSVDPVDAPRQAAPPVDRRYLALARAASSISMYCQNPGKRIVCGT